MTSAAVLARWWPDHPMLEVFSWVAAVFGGVAVVAAVIAWFGDRCWARRYPYDLQLSLDTATGDPGYVVFVLNLGSAPVTVEAWGVLRRADAPRGRLPLIVSESRVQSDALGEVADWQGVIDPMIRIEAGEFCYLQTIPQPEGMVPKPLMDRHQVPDPPLEVVEVEPDVKFNRWADGEALVPFVLVPGAGYIFGAATSGPFTPGGEYPGYLCRCEHELSEHAWQPVATRRGLTLKPGSCKECHCSTYDGDMPPKPFRERGATTHWPMLNRARRPGRVG